MTVQAHLSGQISGQVLNQGTMSQQNGNSQMQNLVGDGAATAAAGFEPSRVSPVDNDILKLRKGMRIKIFNILQQKQLFPTDDASKAKYMDVARRLEEGLFRISKTKAEYMSQSTLKPRLASLIKGRQLNNYNRPQANSSSVGLDNDILKLRQGMQIRIFNILQQKQLFPTDDASKAKYMDVARRLEEGLFRISKTKAEYMSQSTLKPRLASLIKGRQLNNYNRPQANSSSVGLDNGILKLRQGMQIRIFNILQKKQLSPTDDASKAKYMDVARRLEEGLFRISKTKAEYMNQSTLKTRLASLIKGRQLNNNNRRQTNHSSVGPMIPTLGLQYNGGNQNLMITSSVDATMAGIDNVTINDDDLAENTSQMILPTSGFVNSTTSNNSSNIGQSYLGVEASNNNGGFSANHFRFTLKSESLI